MAQAESRNSIQVIERMMKLLEVLAQNARPAGLNNVAQASGLHPSTTHRILGALVNDRMVERVEPGSYRLGIRLLELGNLVKARISVREHALPYMRELHAQTGEAVNLSVRRDDEIVYVERTSSGRSLMRVVNIVGARAPLHITAVGKLFLLEDGAEGLRTYAQRTRLPQYTRNTLTTVGALEKELERIRRNGYAVDNEEAELGVRCIGAGVPDDSWAIVSGFSGSSPPPRHKSTASGLLTGKRQKSSPPVPPRRRSIFVPTITWRGGDLAARQVGGLAMARLREDVGKVGIDKQMLFPTQITIVTSNIGGLGRECARLFNDWVAKLVKGHEDVFLPVAMAPAGCPEAMADELRRCVKELGFRSSHLVPYCGTRNLDDPSFYPYYQAAEELGVALLCHPNSNGELVDRFENFYNTHVLGRPTNCSAALVALVLGGVFEKSPKLKVAFFECSAEWILYWMPRMDDDWEGAKDSPQISGMLKMAPSEYIRRNCYVTCEADEADLKRPIAELGEDRS